MADDDQQSDNQSDNKVQKLEEIRKHALEALAPLAEELDETPERKFEILMTAARFSDDENLLDKTLQVVMSMPDGATKAEALMDVINEVNFRLQPS